MSNSSSRTAPKTASPGSPGGSEPARFGVAYYRTDHELAFYLRAFHRVRTGRRVVVLGLQKRKQALPVDIPAGVRMIFTAVGDAIDLDETVGCFVPDPLEAVLLAMTGLQPKDGLILLFPDDWQGDSPDTLIARAEERLAGLRTARAGFASP